VSCGFKICSSWGPGGKVILTGKGELDARAPARFGEDEAAAADGRGAFMEILQAVAVGNRGTIGCRGKAPAVVADFEGGQAGFEFQAEGDIAGL
jgi:hypothetical protein